MGSAIKEEPVEEESGEEKQLRSGGKVTSSGLHIRSEPEGNHFTIVGFFTSGFSRGPSQTNVSAVETLRASCFIFPNPLASPYSLQQTFHMR